MAELKTSSTQVAKILHRAGIQSTPSYVSDGPHWRDSVIVIKAEATEDELDLVAAVEIGKAKVTPTDNTVAKLTTKLDAELKAVKAKKKPTPEKVVIDDPLKKKS